MQLITTNAIGRTFFLKYRNSIGTCFAIDINGRQYIVTASHVVCDINTTDCCELFYNGTWHITDITVVGKCSSQIDVTVLALNFQIAPVHLLLSATLANVAIGQSCYFLGFPFGLVTNAADLTRFPVPFIKKAVISSISFSSSVDIVYLDGNNNPGFSGGPVVLYSSSGSRDLQVVSVVCGYRFDSQPIFSDGKETTLTSRHNTGIIITHSIRHAVDVIRANPVGFPLPTDGN